MKFDTHFKSIVKLLLVVAFLAHVYAAIVPELDRDRVWILGHGIQFFYKDGRAADYFNSQPEPIGEVGFKIGQVQAEALYYPSPDRSPVSFHAEVELINGYTILFDYNPYDDGTKYGAFKLEITQSSPPLILKEANDSMKIDISAQLRPYLGTRYGLQQFRVDLSRRESFPSQEQDIYMFEARDPTIQKRHHIYIRDHGDHYVVLAICTDVNPFPFVPSGNEVVLSDRPIVVGNSGSSAGLSPGSKVVIAAFISIGCFVVVYYRRTKTREIHTVNTAKNEQTGRTASQSKGFFSKARRLVPKAPKTKN